MILSPQYHLQHCRFLIFSLGLCAFSSVSLFEPPIGVLLYMYETIQTFRASTIWLPDQVHVAGNSKLFRSDVLKRETLAHSLQNLDV